MVTMSDSNLPWNIDRLPKTLYPVWYNLLIQPNFETDEFTGDVSIVINVRKTHSVIIMHAVGLNIESTRVFQKPLECCCSSYEPMPIDSTFDYPPKQYWVISLGQDKLIPGRYTIRIKYTGTFSQQTVGLYKSSYMSPQGEQRDCLLSYFEPTYARHVFPCFDEPCFKAKFRIQLVHPSGFINRAFSNTAHEFDICDYPKEGFTTSSFTLSPKMSTYLVCFLLGAFEHSPMVETDTGFKIAVYSRPSHVNSTTLARDLALSVIQYFEKFLWFNYSFPKLDLIAIPNSHIIAMENWGLITFRESLILLEEGKYSCDDLQMMVQVISHELAHMWFGNLVTIRWWNDLWLKEGFATFMSYVGGAHAYPEWYTEWVPILNFLHPALESDSHLSSHKLIKNVDDHHKIREIFDNISYKKGACLLRMIQDLNPKAFRLSLNSYLNRYKFTTATSQDFWEVLQGEYKDNSFSMQQMMDSWTKQAGYPVIKVASTKRSLVVTQRRFLLNQHNVCLEHSSILRFTWDIPIKYYLSLEGKDSFGLIWLKRNEPSQTIHLPYDTKWILLNWHQIGFYRVNYTLEQWNNFFKLLSHGTEALDAENKCCLLDDAFSLANAGLLMQPVALRLASYLAHTPTPESHFLPWAVVSRHLSHLHSKLAFTNVQLLFTEYVLTLLKPSLSSDIWTFDESANFLKKKLNIELIKMACWVKEKGTMAKVYEMFDCWLKGSTRKLCPDIRQLVYEYGLSRVVSEEVWEKVWRKYLNETNPTEKNNILLGLASVMNPELVKRLLYLTKDETYVRSEVYFSLLEVMSDNYVGNRIVWDYIRGNWVLLVERFSLNDQKLANIVPTVVKNYSTIDRFKELQIFFEKYPEVGCGANARKLAQEIIINNIKWHAAHYVSTEKWLQKYLKKSVKLIKIKK